MFKISCTQVIPEEVTETRLIAQKNMPVEKPIEEEIKHLLKSEYRFWVAWTKFTFIVVLTLNSLSIKLMFNDICIFLFKINKKRLLICTMISLG